MVRSDWIHMSIKCLGWKINQNIEKTNQGVEEEAVQIKIELYLMTVVISFLFFLPFHSIPCISLL